MCGAWWFFLCCRFDSTVVMVDVHEIRCAIPNSHYLVCLICLCSWALKSIGNAIRNSIKNRSKIHQKSIKNPSKIIQNRGWGGSWSLSGRLGRVLGHLAAFWARLEASWERLGRRPGCVLGRPGGVLGGFGVFLGPLGVSWGNLGLDFLAKWGKIEALHLGWHFPIDH